MKSLSDTQKNLPDLGEGPGVPKRQPRPGPTAKKVDVQKLLSRNFLQRFLRKVKFDYESGCWDWRGRKNSGYGKVPVPELGYETFKVHRLSYSIFNGEIPDGLVIDHLCRNTACVNPTHLRAVFPVDNILTGIGMGARNA